MKDFYDITIAGLDRKLPLCKLNEHVSIAGFVMFGDVEMTVACAEALLKRAPRFDVILTAESKGIPLAYEMSKQSGKVYIPARKSAKFYMKEAIAVNVRSITTEKIQTLYLDKSEVDRISGKKVLIVDDVISTGESIKALEQITSAAGGTVVAKMAVLAEGDSLERTDIIYLEPLPLFFNKDIE
ncbi:MAG: adenine phosphoribosyltransferase [Clostridiaceae bacterium]|jgi:adenine phosphoribosyltransferase|nr:adenine phosphoribosyltransferase [Clostridiaceae bacterium]